MTAQYRTVLMRLFPTTPPESLLDLTREQLLDLMLAANDSQPPLSLSTSSRGAQSADDGTSPSSSHSKDLETLEMIPHDFENASEYTDPVDSISDDINALSLSPNQPSSYLGISSTNAVFQVIMWIDPTFRPPPDQIQHTTGIGNFFARENGFLNDIPDAKTTCHTTGSALINAFFDHVHPLTPLLDGVQFRHTYSLGRRRDERWLALLNTVFTLGSMSICTADHVCHNVYFQHAMSFLSLESLGSLHLETVQTLALLAGHYLHFVSQPNLAYSLTGAAIRMAAALGLHKEFSYNNCMDMDLRRSVWWSLFILDTWACMTLGRPTFGRLDPAAITVKMPENKESQTSLDLESLIANIQYCKIATRVQDVFSIGPSIYHEEMNKLDAQLVSWYDQLPPILRASIPSSESIMVSRTTMRWRYHQLRILLHRPALLSYAKRRIPYTSLCAKDRTAIQTCRSVARETIYDIAGTSVSSPTVGRAVGWYIFQAALVPLLGLFIAESPLPDEDIAGSLESCRMQVETAISAVARMEPWCRTARRTCTVISQLFNAAQHKSAPTSVETPCAAVESNSNEHPGANTSDRGAEFLHLSPLHSAPENETSLDGSQASEAQFNTGMADQGVWDYVNWAIENEWCSTILAHQEFMPLASTNLSSPSSH
ncbi:hypothetical protein FQN54_002696 [Arachnomyces sp. PD_36]|nr:hypothetical protein FQN54_002696 [Arachnomyces sp. PD_36]